MQRTFIAIELPQTIQDAIARETSGMRQQISRGLIRWVPVKNMHLTLRFLGDTLEGKIDDIQQGLAHITRQFQPMMITVGGFGTFPNLRRPRVLWIGMQAPPELKSLQQQVETLARQAGFEAETRPFSPHLTVGRVNQRASSSERQALRSTLENIHIGKLGVIAVKAVHLIRSDLHPDGAVYTRLFSARLGKND